MLEASIVKIVSLVIQPAPGDRTCRGRGRRIRDAASQQAEKDVQEKAKDLIVDAITVRALRLPG
jgi:hypothetical protein